MTAILEGSDLQDLEVKMRNGRSEDESAMLL